MDKKDTQITNTTAEAVTNPLQLLTEMLGVGSTNAIEAQEARGQRELVESTKLPSNMNGQRILFEAMGFVFEIEANPQDALFVPATLPPGWRKEATNHSMYSNIVDEKGRKRASVFYKAAFYDRSANMCLERRFGLSMNHNREDYGSVREWRVLDAEEVLFTHQVELPPELHDCRTMEERLKRDEYDEVGRAACRAWLAEHRPLWEDLIAQWEYP